MSAASWVSTVQVSGYDGDTRLFETSGAVNLAVVQALTVGEILDRNGTPSGSWQILAGSYLLSGVWPNRATALDKLNELTQSFDPGSL